MKEIMLMVLKMVKENTSGDSRKIEDTKIFQRLKKVMKVKLKTINFTGMVLTNGRTEEFTKVLTIYCSFKG